VNWSEKSESVVLCEGFYDRSFWSGLLQHIGCTDPGKSTGVTRRVKYQDPWNRSVVDGQFGFASQTSRLIRVKPCHGKTRIIDEIESALDDRGDRRLLRLVVNVDSDKNADGTPATSKLLERVNITELLRRQNIAYTDTPDGHLTIDNGDTEICLVSWNVSEPPQDALPNQQTLERLVCAAMFAAYPERAKCVTDWLVSRHNPPDLNVKEYAWSVMAGWYAEGGCDDFYQCFWRDERLASELESRLKQCGAWQVAAKLTDTTP
jgi:hypothetical protein